MCKWAFARSRERRGCIVYRLSELKSWSAWNSKHLSCHVSEFCWPSAAKLLNYSSVCGSICLLSKFLTYYEKMCAISCIWTKQCTLKEFQCKWAIAEEFSWMQSMITVVKGTDVCTRWVYFLKQQCIYRVNYPEATTFCELGKSSPNWNKI